MSNGTTSLVGKYFMGVDEHAGTGIVEAAINDEHYLVRLDSDGDVPERRFVVAISDMARAGNTGEDNEPPPWLFFNTIEERAKYLEWLDKPEPGEKPKVVPYRRV